MPPASGGTTTTTPGHSDPCARWTVIAHPCRRSDIAFPVTVTGPEVNETSSEPSPVLVTVPTSPLAKPVGSSSRWLAVATTRSPASKPQTVPSPGLRTALSALFSSMVPAGPRCTGVTTCTEPGSMPSARGIESVTSCTTRREASAEPVAGTTTTSRSGESTGGSSPERTAVASRAMAPPSARGPPPALPVQRGRLGHRDGAGVDQAAQHVAGPDRRQLGRVADQQQVRSVGARLQQGGRPLHVEHRGLVDDDDVGVQRPLLVPGESARGALRAEQP